VEALRELHVRDSTDPRLADLARLLYDQAVIAEGSVISDPTGFARRVNNLITREAGNKIGQ
jgi:molecular chaperone HtpG